MTRSVRVRQDNGAVVVTRKRNEYYVLSSKNLSAVFTTSTTTTKTTTGTLQSATKRPVEWSSSIVRWRCHGRHRLLYTGSLGSGTRSPRLTGRKIVDVWTTTTDRPTVRVWRARVVNVQRTGRPTVMTGNIPVKLVRRFLVSPSHSPRHTVPYNPVRISYRRRHLSVVTSLGAIKHLITGNAGYFARLCNETAVSALPSIQHDDGGDSSSAVAVPILYYTAVVRCRRLR